MYLYINYSPIHRMWAFFHFFNLTQAFLHCLEQCTKKNYTKKLQNNKINHSPVTKIMLNRKTSWTQFSTSFETAEKWIASHWTHPLLCFDISFSMFFFAQCQYCARASNSLTQTHRGISFHQSMLTVEKNRVKNPDQHETQHFFLLLWTQINVLEKFHCLTDDVKLYCTQDLHLNIHIKSEWHGRWKDFISCRSECCRGYSCIRILGTHKFVFAQWQPWKWIFQAFINGILC